MLKMSSALSQTRLSRSGVYSVGAYYLGRHCVSLPSSSKMIRKELSMMLIQSHRVQRGLGGCGEAALAAMVWVGAERLPLLPWSGWVRRGCPRCRGLGGYREAM